jgi:hypothetical protein
MEKAYSGRVAAETPNHAAVPPAHEATAAGEPAMSSSSPSEQLPHERQAISDAVPATASAAISEPRESAENIAAAMPEACAETLPARQDPAQEISVSHPVEASAAAEQSQTSMPVSEPAAVASEVVNDGASHVPSESSTPHQAEAALAVAAGAERLMEDAKASAPGGRSQLHRQHC